MFPHRIVCERLAYRLGEWIGIAISIPIAYVLAAIRPLRRPLLRWVFAEQLRDPTVQDACGELIELFSTVDLRRWRRAVEANDTAAMAAALGTTEERLGELAAALTSNHKER